METELPIVTSATARGCCPLDCQDTCSWLAHVEDGRVTRVEGAKDHPFTRGALCAKVNDFQERTYAPDRLLYPMRRSGPKGEGTFERVSWDEAIDLVATGLEDAVAQQGAESILPLNYLGSMGVVSRRALLRVFNALGTSRGTGSVCGAAGNVLEDEGHPRGFDPEDLVNARYVLMWGSNLLSTAHHAWHFIDQARRRNGARIVAIDPIRTRTAKACDEHISIRPGTDAVLAAGLANVMLREGLADLDFASGVAADLEAYMASVERWTPDAVAAVTDVPAAVVERLAREFAAARPAVIRCGVAPQQTVRGESVVRGLSALAIIGGHWRLPGGGLFIETGPDLDETRAGRPDLRPGEVRALDIARLGDTLLDETLDPPVMALVLWNMNPAVTQPDAGRVRAGLQREDLFTVVLEHFMTDTARYADVLLPATTQLEHFDVHGSWGHHYISLNEPAVAPLGEALSHGEIARRLAARLGLAHPALQESDEEIAASALPAGVTLAGLRERGFLKRPPSSTRFATAIRLADTIEAPDPPPAGRLQLLTPKSHYFLNSTFANMPRQRGQMGRPTLEIHPVEAAARGLVEGDEVIVGNGQAELRAWVKVSDAVHPSAVALPGKWWGSATESNAVANMVTPSAWAPHGQPAYNDTFVQVTKVAAAATQPSEELQAVPA